MWSLPRGHDRPTIRPGINTGDYEAVRPRRQLCRSRCCGRGCIRPALASGVHGERARRRAEARTAGRAGPKRPGVRVRAEHQPALAARDGPGVVRPVAGRVPARRARACRGPGLTHVGWRRTWATTSAHAATFTGRRTGRRPFAGHGSDRRRRDDDTGGADESSAIDLGQRDDAASERVSETWSLSQLEHALERLIDRGFTVTLTPAGYRAAE